MRAEQLLLESQKYTQLTPLEMEILFQMAGLERNDGCITFKEIAKISPLLVDRMPYEQLAALPVRALVPSMPSTVWPLLW